MSGKTCSRCRGTTFYRISRRGWLQRTLLSRFGFYPWECEACRKRRYYFDSGHSRKSTGNPVR